MACLDTTFLVDLLRGKKEISDLKEELSKSEPILAVAAPSIMELWAGACLAKASAAEKEKISELLESLEILNLDEKSAKEAGEIEAGLIGEGQIIETEDVMIAAIAKVHGEKIVTRDSHYTKIHGLNVLKY
ncbi:PIN domain-containing protein [Candidatus Woesearchaeota archaeon]|nr:PIN domain-containing protein [Candidatus Woesearchaeota archaeon]